MPEKLSSEQIGNALEDIVNSISKKFGVEKDDVRLYGLEPDQIAKLPDHQKGQVYLKIKGRDDLYGLKEIIRETLSSHNIGLTDLMHQDPGKVAYFVGIPNDRGYHITLGFTGAPTLSDSEQGSEIAKDLEYLDHFREEGLPVIDCDITLEMQDAIAYITQLKRQGHKKLHSATDKEYEIK